MSIDILLELSFSKTPYLKYLLDMKEEKMGLISYLEDLQSKGQYWFLRNEAIKALEISEKAFQKAAKRLTNKVKLTRLRGNFYLLIPPEYRAISALPASWFINVFLGHLNQPYYVGLLSAAALHEAAHQQPMVFQVITNKRTRDITVGQVRIKFYYKKIIEPSFYELRKTETGTMNVSTPEMTAFDLVRYMDAAGQVNNVATVLCELTEKINPTLLSNLLKNNEVEVTSAQRLGYLLDMLHLGIDLAPLESILKQKKIVRRPLINSSNQPTIEHNRRWKILVNEKVEPDEL